MERNPTFDHMVGDGRRTEVSMRVFDHDILYCRPINACSNILKPIILTLLMYLRNAY